MSLKKYFRAVRHSSASPDDTPLQTFRMRLQKRLKQAFGPILPGVLLDVVDFFTAGPIGVYLGMIAGFPLGFWIASRYKLPIGKRIFIGFISGVYCTLPYTEFVPAGTLIGTYTRFLKNPDETDDIPLP